MGDRNVKFLRDRGLYIYYVYVKEIIELKFQFNPLFLYCLVVISTTPLYLIPLFTASSEEVLIILKKITPCVSG